MTDHTERRTIDPIVLSSAVPPHNVHHYMRGGVFQTLCGYKVRVFEDALGRTQGLPVCAACAEHAAYDEPRQPTGDRDE